MKLTSEYVSKEVVRYETEVEYTVKLSADEMRILKNLFGSIGGGYHSDIYIHASSINNQAECRNLTSAFFNA